ncbi:DNA-binding CsgD family transcriptional regulator/predicted transcriptional regulator [Kitasatospora sp. MAP12-15]|uniref:LuxR C-terminal-related transcriptional regulator n=1 Tax=unclassified Kitasatospora TaxID=2633591 RepID=UPI002476E66A|nr:LuxR C-terminal-related transcriptional regulator [Kitasatospora sp. MAP12-44]MDH6113787.1 DNA-binding CsgD family transcriptional regulator/predicted transcriptional regulator [Kitasatospora sp. MAP12-44]
MSFRLDLLGLDTDAAAVYQEMLRDTDAGIAQITQVLGWEEPRVRQALGELEELQLVRPSWQVPGELRAVEPEVGLVALLSHQEAELRKQQEAIEASRLVVRHVVAEYTQYTRSQQELSVEVLTGLDAIRLRIQTLVANCESELMALVPGGAQSPVNMENSRPTDKELLGRGVKMRSIYLESVANDAATVEYARWLTELGAQVRTAPTLPPRMAIYDRRVAMVPVDPDAPGAGAMLVRSPGMVSALCALFDHVWAGSLPLGRRPEPSEHGLTTQEQAVLTLLARGYADEAVGRRLGVSVRTGRRITASLMARLEAGSRFQAGAVAALRGWIDLDTLA